MSSIHSVNKRQELELEALERRLAELEPVEQTKSEPEETNSGSYASIFEPAKKPEGPRTPRIQGRNDLRDNVQNFKVGDYYWGSAWTDARVERQLIPYPQYPSPGQPFASFEEEQRYEAECGLWLRGRLTLEYCVYARAWKESGSLYYDEKSEENRRTDLLWMNGVLAGRGLPLIDDAQLLTWAKSPKRYAKMEDRRPFQIPESEAK